MPYNSLSTLPKKVLEFWFSFLTPAQWFTKSDELDNLIKDKFSDLHASASQCECVDWRADPQGRLAEIIVLDQFSRNIFRDTAQAFTYDALALALTQEAIALGTDELLKPQERSFLYMPIMHSESLYIHNKYLSFFEKHTPDNTYAYELKHKKIIERFGRYPHRNAMLDRTSTPQELEFLKKPDSSF